MTSRSEPDPGGRDPAEIRRRIREAVRAIGRAGGADPSKGTSVLEERAARLAAPGPVPDRREMLDLVRFGAGGSAYALESRWLHEVFRPTALARLPRAKPPAAALMEWRGEILPVLDLARLLGAPAEFPPEDPVALVLGDERARFALLADALPEPDSVPRGTLREVPPGVERVREVMLGAAPDGALVLDGEELLRRHG